MTSNFRCNRLLFLSALLTGATLAASAQNTVVPQPFINVFAGQNTATLAAFNAGTTIPTVECSNPYPDSNNNQSPATTVTLGNGCLPTQAIVAYVYDVKLDPEGDVYISEQNTPLTVNGVSYQTGTDVRVIWNGGVALYNALIAANPQISGFAPQLGHIYTLAGSLTASISPNLSKYYCGGSPTSSAVIASDALGDGCPAAQARTAPRGLALDSDGNVIIANFTSKYGLRVVYVGGTKMSNLIKILNPAVVTPQPGYIYQLGNGGATGDEGDNGLSSAAGGISPRYVAVGTDGNIYYTDGTSLTAASGTTPAYSASGENVRMLNITNGIITTVAGENTCGNTTYVSTVGCPYGYSGDGGPAVGALFNYPFTIVIDQYNNVFIGDYTNARVRVLYRGGTLAPLVNQGITPVVGYIYTYFGGAASSGVQGTLSVDNTPAQSVKITEASAMGLDKAGNLYVLDNNSHYVWRIDAVTGIANIIAGGTSSTATAHAGAYCSGTSGPVSVDNYADGCPALLAYVSGQGSLSFDQQGNFYTGSSNVATSSTPTMAVFKFNYNAVFPATAVGSSSTQYVAFSSTVSNTLTSRTFTLQSGTNAEFTDAGTTACTPTTALTAKATCVVSVTFKPLRPGTRLDKIQFNTATAAVGTEFLSGSGIASDLAVDIGAVSILGTGLKPSGVAADQLGNVFVADTTAGQLLKGASTGTTLAPLATPVTGLKNPSQVAVDNAGNIYIADTGNNRILVTTSAGAALATISSGLSGPKGVAVDPFGNIFVADTGNNRILQVALDGNQLIFTLPALAIPLSAPTQLALDQSNNLYVLDSGNQRIVEDVIATGITMPIALDSGVVPTAMAIDPAGDIYVTDATSKSVLDYYAGATPGYGLVTGFVAPTGIALDPDGNIFVADTGLTGALELRRSLGNIVFPEANPLQTTQAAIGIDNVGNSALHFTAPLYTLSGATPAFFSLAPATSAGCAAGTAYAAGSSCNFLASFTPAAVGTDSATATFITDAADTTTSVAQLNGPAVALPIATTTKVVVVPTSGVFYSLPITLNVTLTPASVTTAPGGTFTLTVDGKTSQPPIAVPASLNYIFTVQLPIGMHTLSVTYSGSAPYDSSAQTVTVPVQPAVTATSLSVTPTPLNGIGSLVFNSMVTVPTNTASGQTGTVTIYAGAIPPATGGVIICQMPISGATAVPAYSISCTSPSLTYASNVFTAVYSGSSNGNFAPSQSATVTPATGDFLVAPVVSSFTIPQGGVGQLNVNVVALYGSSGNVTTSCTGLPANSVCRFTPNTVTLTSDETPQGVLVQIYTNVSSALASNQKPAALAPDASRAREVVFALGLPLGLGLLLLRRRSKLRLLAMFVLGIALAVGATGCGGTASLQTFSTLVTPTGTYNLTLIFTGVSASGETAVHSTPATFTVLPAPPTY